MGRPKLLERTGLGLVCEFDTYCDDEATHLVWHSSKVAGDAKAATLACTRHTIEIALRGTGVA